MHGDDEMLHGLRERVHDAEAQRSRVAHRTAAVAPDSTGAARAEGSMAARPPLDLHASTASEHALQEQSSQLQQQQCGCGQGAADLESEKPVRRVCDSVFFRYTDSTPYAVVCMSVRARCLVASPSTGPASRESMQPKQGHNLARQDPRRA